MSKKLTPQDLINHLYKYKDAVVIIGDDVTKERNFKIDESTKGSLNRKNMVKDPKFFWEYYYQNVYDEVNIVGNEIEQSIWDLLNTDLMPNTIIQSAYTLELFDEVSNIIKLNGNNQELSCVKCKQNYTIDEVFTQVAGNKPALCKCKGRIKPTMSMYGESYDITTFNKAKDLIAINEELQTHTLICIGIDFTEDVFHEFIQSFRAIKKKDNETRFLVMITNGDVEVINNYEADFATAGEMEDSINRLVSLIKEGVK